MLFSSLIFIFFFLPFILFFYFVILKNRRYAQNVFLFGASLFFYAWGEPWFVFIMVLSIIVNWRFGIIVGNRRKNSKSNRYSIALMLVFNLGILFIFKYLTFTLYNINNFTHITVPGIALPIGLSFYTFQAISYVLDISRGKVEAQKKLLLVGLYISFFPQLVAGPIIRYETIAHQISSRKETFEGFQQGIIRFIIGLSKKVLLANPMAIVADYAFGLPSEELSVSFAWIGCIAYTFQIFFDFSGYSDMAIGLAKMFGFHFLENFNYPYISKSISEFWRRWHMSLGQWFRDYVYIPLGGSRVSKYRLIFNLFVVWLLTGIWHGANWTFVCWGLFYFVLLTFEKLVGFEKKWHFLTPFKHIYVILAFMLGWVLFRAESLIQAKDYIKIMFGMSGNSLIDINTIKYCSEYIFVFIFSFLFSMNIFCIIPEKVKQNSIIVLIYHLCLMIAFLIVVSYIAKGSYNPFIYFNF